jgi:hypothetical protein
VTASHDVTGEANSSGEQIRRAMARLEEWSAAPGADIRRFAALLVLAAIYEGIEVIWVLSPLTPSHSRIRCVYTGGMHHQAQPA